MANTPEQNVHSALKSLFIRTLPKGRWILQRIETSTGTGIPDNYFSLKDWGSMWIETKTLAYKVSNDQLNWASAHWRAGGLTYVCTRINNAPVTAHSTPTATSNHLAHATPYPTLTELLEVAKTKQDLGIVTYNELLNSGQIKDELVFLSFDDRMRDCSTLGVYLRRFNPEVLLVEDWVRRKEDHRQS